MYDVEKFLVYFSYNGESYELIASVNRYDNDPFARHYSFSDYVSRVGIYYVAAVDSAGNESKRQETFRSTPCSDYDLPNVFTPNNDGFNDIFKSYYPQDGVTRSVNMQIVNRSGKVVFKTNDPEINWDGRDIDSKRFVSPGVYIYIGELYEEWSTGNRTIPLSGFIHVYHGDGPQLINE
jgi:gliding motility-associated-like protein